MQASQRSDLLVQQYVDVLSHLAWVPAVGRANMVRKATLDMAATDHNLVAALAGKVLH